MLPMTITLVPDPCRWTLTRADHRADVVYADGTGPSFPETFAFAMAATSRFVDWSAVNFDDPVWEIGAQWDRQTGPTTVTVGPFTLTTETVA